MNVTIDRFEGAYAVVELSDRTMVDMPKILIPSNAKEGDIIEIKINSEETKKAKDDIRNLINDVWAD